MDMRYQVLFSISAFLQLRQLSILKLFVGVLEISCANLGGFIFISVVDFLKDVAVEY